MLHAAGSIQPGPRAERFEDRPGLLQHRLRLDRASSSVQPSGLLEQHDRDEERRLDPPERRDCLLEQPLRVLVVPVREPRLDPRRMRPVEARPPADRVRPDA
jgi:hypothetical protein